MKSSTRTFKIPNNVSGSTFDIHINEDPSLSADNLHHETWGSSLALANRLHAIQIPNLRTLPAHDDSDNLSTKRGVCGPVLELGAGTGLVGLSAAAIWHTQVTLTDLPPIIPALATTISLNRELLSSTGGSASCGALDWTHPSRLSLRNWTFDAPQDVEADERNKASVILAADTVYDASHPEFLVNVIKTWLRPGLDSRVVIAYPVRVAYLDEIRELWERMQGIGLQAMEEGKESLPPDEWDDEVLIEWSVWRWRQTESA